MKKLTQEEKAKLLAAINTLIAVVEDEIADAKAHEERQAKRREQTQSRLEIVKSIAEGLANV